jgi:serine protease Do
MENRQPHEQVNRSRIRSLLIIICAFVLGGLVLPNIRISWREPASMAQGAGLDVKIPPPSTTLAESEVYARAAQAAYKAVVNIDTTQRVRVPRDIMDDWFTDGPRYSQSNTEGSGVIISKAGYILTNEHVVGAVNEANRTITVTLTDGQKFQGKVVGSDHTTDVALVKIDGTNLPVAQLGSVKGLVPGQMCVAIGSPLNWKFTVTHGVISALGRPIATPDDRIYPDLIQHDAGINPGNSGGALVNAQGQVIGINTLVETRAQGIGFAIPIDTALRVADELKRFGRIKRPWLGAAVIQNTAGLAARYDLPNIAGVVVKGIYRGSPVLDAGLQQGDVITRINNQPVQTEEQYSTVEQKLRIGEPATLEVHRGDKFANVKVTVGEKP